MSASRWSVIVVLKCVFILAKAENDRSHWAVLTTMVSAILKILVSVGKACSCIVVVVDGKLLKLTLVLFHFLLELVWPANIHLGVFMI